MIQNITRKRPPPNIETALEIVDEVIYGAQHALWTWIHRSLGIAPGNLVFGRDMLLPIPVLADYNLIRQRRQTIIDENNRCTNLRRSIKFETKY